MWIDRFKYFPKKSVRRFLINQALFLALVLGAVILSVRNYASSQVDRVTDAMILASKLDVFVITLCWILFGLGLLYSAWLAYDNFHPLGRLLAKAKSIKRGNYQRDWGQEVDVRHDYGEWYELELTLNKINREVIKRKTDSRRRDIEIEALAGAVSDGVIAIDVKKRVQYFNGPMAMILGKTMDPLAPPSYLDEVFRAPKLTITVDEVIQHGEPRHIQIQMRRHKVVENHVYDVTVAPVKHEKKDEFYGVIAVFHDITEAKKVEEVRIDFVANASHELKTPLTSIKGFVEVLSQDLEREDVGAAKDKLKVIQRNVDRLNELVKDLLELSRLDAGQEATKEEISVEEFTDEMLREVKGLLDKKSQKIQVQYKIDSVMANRPMLAQVMSNLIENAIKYSQEGAQIVLSWQEKGEFKTLKVADNGPGISEQHLSRMFERFYRAQSGKNRSGGVPGTGLGLAIAKNCMLRLGGRIEVDSLPGKGTEFTCYFPKRG